MVTNRRATQEAHERFNVATFVEEINRRHRSGYRVVEEPNPPEAIIQSKRKTSWVEVTSAFMNRSFAEESWSYATPGEMPRPMPSEVIVGPDAQFAANFAATVKKKLEKRSYEPFRDKYGPGYLVVSIQYPLYGRDTPRFMQRAWQKTQVEDRGCFRSIYLVVRRYRGYQVILWRPCNQRCLTRRSRGSPSADKPLRDDLDLPLHLQRHPQQQWAEQLAVKVH